MQITFHTDQLCEFTWELIRRGKTITSLFAKFHADIAIFLGTLVTRSDGEAAATVFMVELEKEKAKRYS